MNQEIDKIITIMPHSYSFYSLNLDLSYKIKHKYEKKITITYRVMPAG